MTRLVPPKAASLLRGLVWTGLVLATAPISSWAQEIEPNDTIAQAHTLVLPYNSESGTISTDKDVDYYKFKGTAGAEVTVWLQAKAIDSSLVSILAFYDPKGKLLAYNDLEWNISDNKSNEDPILYLKLPSTDTYFFAVWSATNFRKQRATDPGSTGKYQLVLLTKFTGQFIDDRNEANDSQSKATLISLPYKSQRTNLIFFGDIDWYVFTAKAGNVLSIDVDSLALKGQSGSEIVVETRVGIYDEFGRLLISNDKGRDPDDGFGEDPAMTFEVTRDGRYTIVVTQREDTKFETLSNSASFLADPFFSSSKNRLGYYELDVRLLQTLNFAHIANGVFGDASYSTSIVLVNYSSTAATGSVSLYKSDGSLLVAKLTNSTSADSVHFFKIPSKGSILLKTDGVGTGSTGYATLLSTVPLGGSAIFSQYDAAGALATEAAVAATSALEFFAFPVDTTGEFNTGIAIANPPGSLQANLFLKLVDSGGSTVATKSMSLDSGRQFSMFVTGSNQLFPSVSNFRGSIQVLSDASVAAVALRSTARTLTALPPIPLNQDFPPATLYFPHVVVGPGAKNYRTTIILTNTGFFRSTGAIRFTRSDGSPMPVTIRSIQASSHTLSIPPQGTVFLETAVESTFSSGYAVVEIDHAVGGALIFSQFDPATGSLETEAAVTTSPSYSDFLIFAQAEEGYSTGYAVANPNATTSILDYTLFQGADNVTTQKKGPLSLATGRHIAEFVNGADQLFPNFTGQGTLEIKADIGLPAVALRITARTITALPVVPIR